MSGKKYDGKRFDFNELKQQCAGQWPSIINALSQVDLSEAFAKIGKHVRCHRNHGSTKRQFRLFKDFGETGGGVCNTCGSYPDGFSLLDYLNDWDRKTAVREVANYLRDRGYTPARTSEAVVIAPQKRTLAVNKEHAKKLQTLWKEAVPIDGTPAEAYLRNRGIDGELPNSGDVGYHHRVLYWDSDAEKVIGHFPTMLSVLRTSQSGHPLSIHRIYLDRKGKKANVPEVKKLMPCSVEGAMSDGGAAIRLYKLDGDSLAITEGIETAIAVRSAHPNLPVWAAFSAQVLSNFVPPASVKNVYIFGDVDPSGAGQAAAARLALRLESKGIKAKLCLPAKMFALPPHSSGWYSKQHSLAAMIQRVHKDGYELAMKSPKVDWNDLLMASKAQVVAALNGPPIVH